MTIATLTIDHQGTELTAGARSYMYGTLASAFSYPDDGLLASLPSGEWMRQLKKLAQHVPFELPLLNDLPSEFAADDLQQAYVSTFEVGAGRPFCPLYEGSHRSGRMKLMEELVRFYEHFGLKTTAGDHPDHLAAELEFMHYMSFKEAAAAAHNDDVADVRRAQRDFLDRHLCKWLPRLRIRLSTANDLPEFYVSAANLADQFCSRDLAWLKKA
jgi:DMSO reductase family type II enzyme chaperone